MSNTPALSPEALLSLLEGLGLAPVTHRHRPVFTVAEGADLKAQLPGVHTKNLFLKDKKGALALLSAAADTAIDLNAFAKAAGFARLSFGAAALLQEALGVQPGSVTAFAIANDPACRVELILDAALFAGGPVNFHPLTNTATTALSPAALWTFLDHLGRRPRIFAFPTDGPPRLLDAAQVLAHLSP